MVATIFEQYGVEGGEGDDAYINLKENYGSDVSGFLWTNFSGVGMQYYMCKLYPDDAEQKDTYRKMLNNFKYFRQSNPESNAAENSVKYPPRAVIRRTADTGTVSSTTISGWRAIISARTRFSERSGISKKRFA